MKALLDTNAFIWSTTNDSALSEKARALISDPASQIMLSVISAWELVIKKALGRLLVSGEIGEVVQKQVTMNHFEILPMTLSHALCVADLPSHHKDPFDRALIAQAQIENMPIISADRALARYPVEVIW